MCLIIVAKVEGAVSECVSENPLSSGASTDTSKGNSPAEKSDQNSSDLKPTILGTQHILKIITQSLKVV